jgi:hypothetical protein
MSADTGKPKFRMGQVVMHENLPYKIRRIFWDSQFGSRGAWRYKMENSEMFEPVQRILRPLTKREKGGA